MKEGRDGINTSCSYTYRHKVFRFISLTNTGGTTEET